MARGPHVGLGISFHPLPRASLAGGGRKDRRDRRDRRDRAGQVAPGNGVQLFLIVTSLRSQQGDLLAHSVTACRMQQTSGVSVVPTPPKCTQGYISDTPAQGSCIQTQTFAMPQKQQSYYWCCCEGPSEQAGARRSHRAYTKEFNKHPTSSFGESMGLIHPHTPRPFPSAPLQSPCNTPFKQSSRPRLKFRNHTE